MERKSKKAERVIVEQAVVAKVATEAKAEAMEVLDAAEVDSERQRIAE